VPDTGGTITAETFTCAHDNKFRTPEVTPEEELWTAAQNLTKAITRNPGKRSFIGEKIDELKKIKHNFQRQNKRYMHKHTRQSRAGIRPLPRTEGG